MGRAYGAYAPATRNGTANATVSVSSANSSTVVTATPPGEACAALISAETTDGRFTCDGLTTPDATHGHLLKTAATTPFFLPLAAAIKWVSTAGTASVLQITWLE